MKGADRKAAIAAYKERKGAAGIYAVRCAASGAIWVGQTPTLDTVQNRIWFSLRMGGHPDRELQAAWRTHGAESFAFDVLEQLEEADADFARTAELKVRLAHWQAKLGAQTIA